MIRTRFAPSPTGSLHVGGVRTALYCQLFAIKNGGTFVIRIEDTDRKRSTAEAATGIQNDLKWCGLMWDEGPGKEGEFGPYFQSERLELYNKYIEQLLTSGHAFLAWESSAELQEMRQEAQKNKRGFKYKKVTYTDEQLTQFTSEDRVPVVRLQAPSHDITVHDEILGHIEFVVNELEDVVIRKADGFPTYHFAVVVDDHHMNITHVLRGQEHLMNTPKHLGIYEALGWEPPKFGHLPIINNPFGSKMSKRDKAKEARAAARDAQKQRVHGGGDPKDWSWLAHAISRTEQEIEQFMKKKHDRVPVAEDVAKELGITLPLIEVMDFRKSGYLPEALLNYMALLGWNPGDEREMMTFSELATAYSLDRVSHTSAKFDPEKLRWMNGEYIKSVSDERLLTMTREYLDLQEVHSPLHAATDSQMDTILSMYRPRIATLGDLIKMTQFLFVRPSEYNEKSLRKHVLKGDGVERLRSCRTAVTQIESWDRDTLEQTLLPIGEGNMGKVAQPLRMALTGNTVSPDIFEVTAFFTKEEVLARLDALIHECQGRIS